MIEIGAIVWGVTDIERAARFWSLALDYEVKYISDDFAMLKPKEDDGIQLSLKLVTSPNARRHHIDLFTDDQAGEIVRLLSLGASFKSWDYEEDADYTVLVDPDGNPFCVVQI